MALLKPAMFAPKHFIAQHHSYTHRGHQLGGHVLELLPLLARHLFALNAATMELFTRASVAITHYFMALCYHPYSLPIYVNECY